MSRRFRRFNIRSFGELRNRPFFTKFFGDRAFYRTVLLIIVPIIVQSGISNFVSMLDNIMVGRIGTEPMSGVSIANQLIFVFNLCIFGGLGGVGIFTAQYYGKNDQEGIRSTVRFKLIIGAVLVVIATALFLTLDEPLLSLYLNGESDAGDLDAVLRYGKGYLKIILLSLPAFMVINLYSSTLRECGETVVPMVAGLVAVMVNLVFNWFLIYGKLFFPKLGVNGAAIATVMARYVEMGIVIIWTHTHTKKQPWAVGVFRTLRVPMNQAKAFFKKGMPLLLNEGLWSSGMAILAQCYSMRGINAVVGLNIAQTINNVLNIVFLAMGNAIAILVGQLLGAGKNVEAKDTDNKLIMFGVLMSLLTSGLLVATSTFFPEIYNTNADAKMIARQLMCGYALFCPLFAFNHCAYFTLRSGGKTIITFLFDSMSVWFLSVPIAFLLTRLTDLPVIWLFILVNSADIIKVILGYILVKKNIWINNITVPGAKGIED